MSTEVSKVYIFHRGDMFYPLSLKDDQDAIKNAEWNPGTTKVTDANGKVIWQPLSKTFKPNNQNQQP